MDGMAMLEELDNFEVNEWGSCQYAGALAFFKVFQKMKETMSWEQIMDHFGIKVTFTEKLPFDKAKDLIINEVRERNAGFEYEDEQRVVDAELMTAQNGDDLMQALANLSWDLWGAAPFVLYNCLPNLNIDGTPQAKGRGPVGNQIVRESNYFTGLCCALLVEFGYVKEADTAFADFDT